jgi:hypothetical protein
MFRLALLIVAASACIVASPVRAGMLIFSADGTNDLIRRFNASGRELTPITNRALRFPTLLAATRDGRSLITNINFVGQSETGTDLIRLDLKGRTLARKPVRDIFGSDEGGPVSVVDTGRKTLLITSTQNTTIAETDYHFNPIRLIPTGAAFDGLRTLGIAMSPGRTHFWVADADAQSGNGFLRKFDYTTGLQVATLKDQHIRVPIEVEFSRDGRLFVSDRGETFEEDMIHEFDSDLSFVKTIFSGALLHYNFGAFKMLPNNTILVVETNYPTRTPLRRLTFDGSLISQFGPSGVSMYDVIAVKSAPPKRRDR